jgi:hypothetical protein
MQWWLGDYSVKQTLTKRILLITGPCVSVSGAQGFLFCWFLGEKPLVSSGETDGFLPGNRMKLYLIKIVILLKTVEVYAIGISILCKQIPNFLLLFWR